MAYLTVAFGGALGAMARYWVYNALLRGVESRFPWATLLVNVSGSLLIGIAFVVIVERNLAGSQWQNMTSIGFLGAFTTFSTFSLDALELLEQGQIGSAAAYIAASVVLCLLAAWLGIAVIRQLL